VFHACPAVLVTGASCYAVIGVSLLAVAATIASTEYSLCLPRLSWVGWTNQIPRQYSHERSAISALTRLNLEYR